MLQKQQQILPMRQFSDLDVFKKRHIDASASPELTIIIPTFCERDNIVPLLNCIEAALAGISWEVLFVDDDSPDGTATFIKSIGVTDARVRCIRRIGRRGLAGACVEGMLASQAPYVAVMDADLQHDERLLVDMLVQLRADTADLVIGTRYALGRSIEGFSAVRRTGSWIANFVVRKLMRIEVTDPMSGFFMMRRSIVEEISPQLSTRGFKILMDILASVAKKTRVIELPYHFRVRQHGDSKLDNKIVLDFLELLTAKISRGLIPDRFISFMLVGVSGIVVHLSVLTILHFLDFSLSFIEMQTIATVTAMGNNFLLNNTFTYHDQRLTGQNAIIGFIVFSLICSFGVLSNISVAGWLYGLNGSWWLAGLLGSIVSAVWNFAVSRTLIWRG